MKTAITFIVGTLLISTPVQAQQGCQAPFRGWGDLATGELPAQGSCLGLAAGRDTLVVLRGDGTLVASGIDQATPAGAFLAVSAGLWHAAAIRTDRRVIAWGFNHQGQTDVPADLPDASEIATTYNNTAIIDIAGALHVWGWAAQGLTTPPAGSFRALDGGEYHFAALRSDGAVACWGFNDAGQSSVPVDVGACIAVAAGGGIVGEVATGHTVVVKSDGYVRCWGNNSYGQCTVPTGLSDVVTVAAGGPHSIALLSDGRAVCWGDNRFGQSIPPAGMDPIASVVAGERTSFGFESCCLGDLNADSLVNGSDLGIILAFWGPVSTFPRADLNGDGFVSGADLGILLANWGSCT
jgi:hypothetical protein